MLRLKAALHLIKYFLYINNKNIIELENLSCRTWKFDYNINIIEQKGMPFDHDFGYSCPLSSCPIKKREEEKEND